MLPKNRPTSPGEFVREDILKELSITEAHLAEAIGVSLEIVHQLINGEQRISIDMALRLGRFTQTTPQMWLNLQAAVDLWDACHSPYFKKISKIQPYAA